MQSLKPNKYRIVGIEQGSPEWHKFRSSHVGASETPIIMEASPYMTPFGLWQEKLGLVEKKAETDSMKAGHIFEPEIRAFIEKELKMSFKPATLEFVPLSWMSASLDGFNEEQTIPLECKLNNKENHEIVRNGKIPEAHFYQCQKQLLVTDCLYLIYASYHDSEILYLEVYREEGAIAEIIKSETEFWNDCINSNAPRLLPKDYVNIDDPEWNAIEYRYAKIREDLEPLENEKKILEKELKDKCEHSSIGKKVKISVYTQRGCVDYESMVKELGIDIEKYRNSSKIVKKIYLI